MKTLVKPLAGLALVALAAAPGQAVAADLSISCGAIGVELTLCREGVAAWSAETGVEVEIVSTPNSSTERLALYQQILAAEADDIDILQVDVVWPGVLAPHLVDLKAYLDDAGAGHFDALIANNTVDGRLVALPWWTDAGVLYYRADLLEKHGFEAPTRWAELGETARAVMAAERAAGADGMWGYVWQGKAYEGLTCNALEWFASSGGGTVVAPDGAVTVNNQNAREMLAMAASWVGDITPEGVLNYDEEAARGVFQSGNAVFMRNWPYAWALAQGEDSPVRGKVGVVALPSGADGDAARTGTLGGWNLAVSKYSKNPEQAADLVRFLTSAEQQKKRAAEASYNPTRPALYEDAEVIAANPFFKTLLPTFENAVARPSTVTGENYNRVSAAFWARTHAALSGRETPEAALASLENQLLRISRGGRW